MRPSAIAQVEMNDHANVSEWTLTDYGDLAVVLVVVFFGGALAGFEYSQWLRIEAARAAAAAPKPVVVPHSPLSQWTCTPQEFAEHRGACAHRHRSALIKPKE